MEGMTGTILVALCCILSCCWAHGGQSTEQTPSTKIAELQVDTALKNSRQIIKLLAKGVIALGKSLKISLEDDEQWIKNITQTDSKQLMIHVGKMLEKMEKWAKENNTVLDERLKAIIREKDELLGKHKNLLEQHSNLEKERNELREGHDNLKTKFDSPVGEKQRQLRFIMEIVHAINDRADFDAEGIQKGSSIREGLEDETKITLRREIAKPIADALTLMLKDMAKSEPHEDGGDVSLALAELKKLKVNGFEDKGTNTGNASGTDRKSKKPKGSSKKVQA
jgi:hypothetical protein